MVSFDSGVVDSVAVGQPTGKTPEILAICENSNDAKFPQQTAVCF
jgi:hypothetical protein